MANPTIVSLEQAVAVLEGGYNGLGCSSGMAAIHTTFVAMLSAGDHLICSEAVYGPTATLIRDILMRFGVQATIVDTSNLDAVRNALKPETKMIYIETPGNPTMVISDIKALSEIAHAHGARLVVDNTFMSPILQQPLKHGADVVLHSMTKFLNGHADVIAGIIVVSTEGDYRYFRSVLDKTGGVIDPFNSFLVSRGIKTLAIRMQRHCENATKIAEFLVSHPLVDRVYFPGLPSHPHYDVVKRQMNGPGGVISFELKGGLKAGKTLMNSVKLHMLAVSLGGVETLIQHPASMTHATMGPEARKQARITDSLVRISVGIENVNELIEDLEQALAKVKAGMKSPV
jgi:methionine-gamma-lyase